MSLREKNNDEGISETQIDSNNEDNSEEETFIEVDNTANNNVSDEQRTTSNFESMKIITSNNNTKSLTIKELQLIFNEILSSYRTCSETTQFVLGSIALSARDMCATDGKSKGLFDKDEDVCDNNMLLMMKNLIHKHRSYFAGSSNTFLTDNSEQVVRPCDKKLRMGYKKRLRSKAEEYKKKPDYHTSQL